MFMDVPSYCVISLPIHLGKGAFASKGVTVSGQFYQSAASPRPQRGGPAQTVLQWTSLFMLPYGPVREFLWDLHTGAELLGHGIIIYIILLQQCLSAFSSGHTRYSSPAVMCGFPCLHIPACTWYLLASLSTC